MSASALTSEAQLRYLLQWFGEFSELQREDFLPILVAARQEHPDQLSSTLAALTCQDKPISLFQCRIKLFNEWYPTWSEEERDRLIKGVSETDEDFGNKLQELLLNGPQMNGEVNGFNGTNSSNEEEEGPADEAPDAEHQELNIEEREHINEGAQDSNIPVEIAAS